MRKKRSQFDGLSSVARADEGGSGAVSSGGQLRLSSLIYSLGQITLGLLLHPYQTMQSLLEDRAFLFMSFLPVGVWILAKAFWHWLLVPSVRVVFSCQTSSFALCELIPFLAKWMSFFALFWQLMLLYLLLRFWYAWR